MNKRNENIIIFLSVLTGCFFLLYWMFHNPVKSFAMAVPGLDNRPPVNIAAIDSVVIGEKFIRFDSSYVPTLTGKWPWFRGADRDNIDKEQIKLIDKWPQSGPKILWKKELGEGHAGASIYNGRVYVMDYDERKRYDVLHCYSLVEGKELWRRFYAVNIKRNHGFSRTIPAVNDKYVVTIGPHCQVMCCNAITGGFLWGIDLPKKYRATIPLWYTGQCPLIDNDVAVIAAGGKALLLGVDCATGNVAWQTPNPDSLKMSHSSIIPMTLAGKKMYVYNSLNGLIGVSAEDGNKGKLLWRTTAFKPSVIAPSPVYVGQDRIFVSAGYGAGAALFRISGNGDSFSVQTIQQYKPAEGMSSEQQTPIYTNGLVFNIQTKDAGSTRNQFVCCRPDDFRKILWTSSTDQRFGLGPYIIADNKFYILSDEGEMTIARFNTSGFEVLDRKKVLDGVDSWGPIALADGYMIMRDSRQMICVDMKAE